MQAQKSMKNGAYEDAAKHLFSAYSLEMKDRAEMEQQLGQLRRREKELIEEKDKLQASLARAQKATGASDNAASSLASTSGVASMARTQNSTA